MYSSNSKKRKVIKVKSDIAIEAILFALEDHICIKECLPLKKRNKCTIIEQSNKKDTTNTAKDKNIFDSVLFKK